MSSCDASQVSSERFLEWVQGHGQVENRLHWQKDRFYGEDKHVCGDDWGTAFSILTNMVVALVNLLRKGERTLKEVREMCSNANGNGTKMGIQKKLVSGLGECGTH